MEKNTLKLILAPFLILVVGIAWFVLNSSDAKFLTTSKLETPNKVLADVDNGYFQLEGLDNINDSSEAELMFNDNALKAIVYGKMWDEPLLAELVNKYERSIESVKNANKYDKLKVPVPDEPFALPEYIPIINLNRLVISKALLLKNEKQYDASIKLLEHATKFSQRVKMDQNFYLISYMIGLVMEYESVLNIHYLSGNSDLSAEQLISLKNILLAIPSYDHDQFPMVFWGEYQYSQDYFDEFLSLNLTERWRQYSNNEDWMVGSSWIDDEFSLSREVYRLMVVAAPKFYLHKNRSLNNLAEYYLKYQDRSKLYCIDTAKEPYEYDWYQKPTWEDIFLPNSLGANSIDEGPDFDGYMVRRCFAKAYIESVKAIVALQLYKKEQGEFPESLDEISNEYLSKLPIDPFNGQSLNYDKTNNWLTSVGRDHVANDVSEGDFYYHHCFSDDACSIKPIFPLDASLLSDEIELLDGDDAYYEAEPIKDGACESGEELEN